MRKIVYYVAMSIDGFISGLNDDISQFIMEGSGVDRYRQDLADFDAVIMGRKTYEFGYKYGLKPGEPAYPNMKHYIFSDSLEFESTHEQVNVVKRNIDFIKKLKEQEGKAIYLCGGGQFAGWLLENGLIDILKIKLNPVVLGEGVRLFGSTNASCKFEVTGNDSFDDGLQFLTFEKK